MANLTKEQYEQLPEFIRADYVEVNGVYKHDQEIEVESLNGKVSSLKLSLDNLDEKMKSAERERQEEIAKAANEAREKALKEAKENNNVDEILRLEREKLDDERKRMESEKESLTAIKADLAGTKKEAIIKRLSVNATDSGRAAFELLIDKYILIDPETRQETFLNADGSASSLSEEDFIKELAKNPIFKTVLKAGITTTGGGMANGSTGGSTDHKKLSDMTEKERVEMKNTNPDLFRQLLNKG